MWLNLNRQWKWCYVEPDFFVEASLNFIASNEYVKFFLPILSSKLHLFYFKQVGRMHDKGGYMCKIDTISSFPIPQNPPRRTSPIHHPSQENARFNQGI